MRIVYVSHNAVGSALARSQVLPYLRGLIARGIEITLVTYERGESYPEGEFPRERWIRLRPRPGRSLVAKALDIARGAATVLRLVRRERTDLVHARSYVPAAIAWSVARLTGCPYVFDMRGFLGEEYVEGGNWSDADLRYRALRAGEGMLLRDAAGIVVLTRAAVRQLESEARYAPKIARKPVAVVPCAVDLARFRPGVRSSIPTLVYAGSVGLSYELDRMLGVFARARSLVQGMRLLLLNRDERGVIEAALARRGLLDAGVEVRGADFGEMPELLARAHVGIALLRQVSSKIGSSPIKVAEYLACGLPVVVNAGMGDTDELVARYGAGHVVREYTEDELARAARAVAALVVDEEARRNARRLAEAEFDVDHGVQNYADLYALVLGRHGSGR